MIYAVWKTSHQATNTFNINILIEIPFCFPSGGFLIDFINKLDTFKCQQNYRKVNETKNYHTSSVNGSKQDISTIKAAINSKYFIFKSLTNTHSISNVNSPTIVN